MSRTGTLAVSAPEPRPWRRAICWLAFLAPFFYLSYGAANAIAARRHDVPSIVFAWERHLPFLDWTIIPYWSINAFYGLSFFVCATRAELDAHGRRLLTAQIVAVVCFILFPLKFTFQQPAAHGVAGVLFAVLSSFDKPFNQAPSLHVALLVILWRLYAKHLPRPASARAQFERASARLADQPPPRRRRSAFRLRPGYGEPADALAEAGASAKAEAPSARRRLAQWPLHTWFALVGTSVLTTYQHHFFDIPTGALLGIFCMWLWPVRGKSPLATARLATDPRRLVLATRYLIGSGLIVALALWIGGMGLWLLWPAVSLVLVSANYAIFGPEGFQKDADGSMRLAARLLLAPYLAGAFVNSRSWTRHERKPVAIGDGVWLGRIPLAREAEGFDTVVDVCAELPGAATAGTWTCIPMLDLVPPQPAQLRDAAASIERARSAGPVLVCCALGYSRSAATVATWLITSHATNTMSEAIEKIRRARPRIVIDTALSAAIATATERGA